MHQHEIVLADAELELSQRFEKWHAFNITNGAAQLLHVKTKRELLSGRDLVAHGDAYLNNAHLGAESRTIDRLQCDTSDPLLNG
jgi:hypothetical protein